MSLAQAKAAFLEQQQQRLEPGACVASLGLFCSHFAGLALTDITPVKLHQFLSAWFLEETIAHSTSFNQTDDFPDAQTMIACLTDFFTWASETPTDNSHTEDVPEASLPQSSGEAIIREHLAVLQSLQQTLPRAIAITRMLSNALANRGGAITFPEFLTSFEEGGQSAYDIGGTSGEASAIEGYFQILRIDGTNVVAEELISEREIFPILFPQETAALLDIDYIINLELVYLQGIWQIVNCGFAYPPDTEM
jgi:hypothetical protein